MSDVTVVISFFKVVSVCFWTSSSLDARSRPRLARRVRLPFPSAYMRSLSGPSQCSCSPQPNQSSALTYFAVCPIQTMQIAAVPLPWVSDSYVLLRTSHILQIHEIVRRCGGDLKNPQCRRLSISNTSPYCSLSCLPQQPRRKIFGASASGRLRRLLQAKAHRFRLQLCEIHHTFQPRLPL